MANSRNTSRPLFGYPVNPAVPYIPRFPIPPFFPPGCFPPRPMWYPNVGPRPPPNVFFQPGISGPFYNRPFAPRLGPYAPHQSRPGINEFTGRAEQDSSLSNTAQTGTSKKKEYSSLREVDTEFYDEVKDTFIQVYWKIYNHMEPTPFNNTFTNISPLCRDIWKFYTSSQLPSRIYIERISFWKQLDLIIDELVGTCQLKTIGSTISGLAITDSNFNLHLKSAQDKDDSELLQAVQQVLKKLKEVDNLKFVSKPIPLLSFTVLSESPFKATIVCNNSYTVISTQFVYAFVQCDWRVQPLFNVIKSWAIYYKVIQKGVLNSFHLTLMLIHFLQCGVSPEILPNLLHFYYGKQLRDSLLHENQLAMFNNRNSNWRSLNNRTLSQLLMQFLQYYEQFDFKRNIISIRFGQIQTKRSYFLFHNTRIDEDIVFIEEPYALINTAGHVHLSILETRLKCGTSEFLKNMNFSKCLHEIYK